MHTSRGWIVVAALWAVLASAGPGQARPAAPPIFGALIEQAAGRIDDTLAAVAQSARGLGQAYRDLSRAAVPVSPEERGRWLQNYAVKDGTVAFRDQDSPCGPQPDSQAPCPAYLFYDGENFTDETFRQLGIMTRLAPALEATHAAFPFSWVYLTTPNQNFCIYPYLSLSEAVNNYKPTEKDFYTTADFANKACGWESPYLDLAGAGMMVTVSCPVYDEDKLLAVASRDITLKQLSRAVLAELGTIPGAKAVLMNRRGKAIAASDPGLAAFIDAENAKAGEAVVYFRADRGLAAMGLEKGESSSDEEVNAAAESVIERAESGQSWPIAASLGKKAVLAARTHTTGWYLVLLVPERPEKAAK